MWIAHIQVAEITFYYKREVISFCFYLPYINIFFEKCLCAFQVKFLKIRIRAWKLLFKGVIKKIYDRNHQLLLDLTEENCWTKFDYKKPTTWPLSSIWLRVALPPGGSVSCFKMYFQVRVS